MNSNMTRALLGTFILMAAGCGNEASAPDGTADRPAATADADPGASTSAPLEAPLLSDELPAESPQMFDDEDAAADADGIDILADDVGDVKFTPVATTNLRVTAEDMRYVQLLKERAGDTPTAEPPPANTSETAEVSPAQEDVAVADTAATTDSASASASAPVPASATASTAAPAPLDEKEILKDKKGQWAVSATASSTYAQSPGDKAPYSPWQATGAPNVPRYSDDGAAWASKSGDSKDPEWLEVTFARPVHATAIRIRQNTAPGAISRIDLIDEGGQSHPVWAGTDDTVYAKNSIGWLIRDIPRTQFKVRAARITLMTARVWGWNEIDAVQLVGEP